MAKRKKKTGDDKSKSSKAVTFVKKRKASPRRNPDDAVSLMVTDLAAQAVPVVVAFAGTHVAAHVVGDRLLGGRSWSRHIKVLTALTAIVGTYFAGRSKALEKYQTGAMVGATLAALQTLFQAYVPQFSWVLGAPVYAPPQLAAPAAPVAGPRAAAGDDDDMQDDDDLSDLQGIFIGGAAGSGWNA